jgi:glycosyltransferase involved in cell wall biosynthesis
MRVLVLTSQVPFVRGGAEIHAENLVAALTRAGHEAEQVQIPFLWYPPEKMLDHLLACRLLDVTQSNGVPVDRVIGLRFPAYHIPHPNKVMWILHQQRPVFDLWNTEDADLAHYPHGRDVREAIITLERQLLHEARALYANSRNVAERLGRFTRHEAQPLYHPPGGADDFFSRPAESFLFYPSRLCGLKRQDLVLRALAETKETVKVRFAGRPDHPDYVRELQDLAKKLGVADRVEWLGGVDEATKLDHYARCLGVVFPPVDEDYGYITLEAMLSHKPVITCHDSGGPLEFVEDGVTGLIADSTPTSLAAAMDRLWADPTAATTMGQAGRDRYTDLNISWEHVVTTLLTDGE